uniref:Uncharacterized protein n=1 Tax=viral metagenome TaxID=1070528 RepID=A0A6M3LNY4_9ZZZZ
MIEVNPFFNLPCQYNPAVKCIVINQCTNLDELTCLQGQILRLNKELYELKRRRVARHDKMSLKWRDSAFYTKKRFRILTEWLKKHDIKYPSMVEAEKELHSHEEIHGSTQVITITTPNANPDATFAEPSNPPS